MSYAITHLFDACSKNSSPAEVVKRRDRITMAVDFLVQALLITALVVLTLISKDIIPVQMSSSLNTVVTAAFYGSCALSILVSLADTVVFCVKQRRQNLLAKQAQSDRPAQEPFPQATETNISPSNPKNTEELRGWVLAAPEMEVDETHSREIQRTVGCHPMTGGLFLGGAEAFMEASHMPGCYVYNEKGELIPFATNNPHQFTRVISLCPLDACTNNYANFEGKYITNPQYLSFSRAFAWLSSTTWLYLGRELEDKSDAWPQLVERCTFLAKNDKEKEPPLGEEKQWFAPLFDKLDKAVFSGTKTLLHCSTGQSVSVAVFAAYLIKRCHVTHTEALRFIMSRRPCIDCKFESDLEAYAKALGVIYPS